MLFFKLAGGERFIKTICGRQVHRGIATLAAQEGVATLTEGRDATVSVMQFSSAAGE